MLLLEIQQQQLQLEKQHQEMLLLQQQQQQLRMHGALSGTPALTLPMDSAAAASPETLALVQQQQLLVQQKMQLQALRAAMEQNSQRLASYSLSSISGPVTPAGLEAARTSYPGFQQLSPANTSPSSSLNGMGGVGVVPAASASCAGFKPAFSAAVQQAQMQPQINSFHAAAAAPTAAAAAAALAGSNGLPFMDRAAAAGGMDVWAAAAAAEEADMKMARSKSAGHGLLNGADIPEGAHERWFTCQQNRLVHGPGSATIAQRCMPCWVSTCACVQYYYVCWRSPSHRAMLLPGMTSTSPMTYTCIVFCALCRS